jgi:hypothetical protein
MYSRTAKYQEKKIYISHIDEAQTYALASYHEDLTQCFKVNLSDLTDMDFKLPPKEL